MSGDEYSDFKSPIGRTFLSGNRVFGIALFKISCISQEEIKGGDMHDT
jgi:hypothetical protein